MVETAESPENSEIEPVKTLSAYEKWKESGGSVSVPLVLRFSDKYTALFPYMDKGISKARFRPMLVVRLLMIILVPIAWFGYFLDHSGVIGGGTREVPTWRQTQTASAAVLLASPTELEVVETVIPTATVNPRGRGFSPVQSTAVPFIKAPIDTLIPTLTQSPTQVVKYVTTLQPTSTPEPDLYLLIDNFWPDEPDGSDCLDYDFENLRCRSPMHSGDDWRGLDLLVAACPIEFLGYDIFIPEFGTVRCLDTSRNYYCSSSSMCQIAILSEIQYWVPKTFFGYFSE